MTMSRPCTAQSRPTTSRPQTAVSTNYENSWITALFEGRGVAREVGIAALERETGWVTLVQLADCQTYVKTLHQMHLHPPSLILVPDTSLARHEIAGGSSARRRASSVLLQYVEEEFPGVPVEPIARKYWNDRGGMDLILQLGVDDEDRPATLVAASQKYYALSAVCSLLKYAELKLNTRYAAGSLRIRYVAVEGTMMIDVDTARNLELVNNVSHKKSRHSLFGILNYTYTAMAGRLLRVNVLSPITACSAIDARLDVVEELVQSEERFTDMRDALKAFNKMDFDKLIASLAACETRASNSAKSAAARVSQLLNLRNAVRNLPRLQAALAGSRSRLLQIVHELISDVRLRSIESLVCSNLNEECTTAKGGITAVNARVYAVKANRNRLLDVARETYKENVGDIYQLSNTMAEQYNLPLTLLYQENGFAFSLKKTELEGDLPKGFINVSMQKGRWLFSSLELKKMNARMKDALDETLILSDKIIQDIVAQIIVDIGALYKASEAVALIDMLWSFAHAAILRNYVRPEFTGTLAVKSGRHPILEVMQPVGAIVPNDVYCDDSSHFQMIHGPNMSGKSTYLRQIGLLTVMAMCGSFVPAEYASFRLHDALLSRLSNDDDLEKNFGTFASEMASSAMILGIATPKSLVLIDELGRGTSPVEGPGIAHAIAERLIELKPFVFFATHYDRLVTTLSRKPSVVNLHLSVQKGRQSTCNFGMTFQYKIIDGAPDDLGHYGLELARLADLPDDVLAEGKRISTKLMDLDIQHQRESRTNKITERRKALLRLQTQLTQALDYSTLPDMDLLTYIGRIQADIAKVFLQEE